MAKIVNYEKKNGSKGYMTSLYIGVDPITGKKKRTTIRANSLKELRLKIARVELDNETNGVRSKQEVFYYIDVYNMWIEQHKNTIRESTKESIEKWFRNQILPEIGSLKINKINTAICQKAVNNWSKTVVAYPQMKGYASKVFDYGINNNLCKDNPMKRVIVPRKEQKINEDNKKNYYTLPELKYFFECLKKENDTQAFTFMRLIAFTGCRRGEISALTWEDIDYKNKTIRFNKNLVIAYNSFKIQPPKTSASNRVISLDDITLKELSNWQSIQKQQLLKNGLGKDGNSKNLIFTNKNRKQTDYIYLTYGSEIMKYLQKKYQIKRIKIHGFRHTHASLLFESGATIKDVQTRLGHTDIQTTMNIYTHVTDTRKEETAKHFADYVNF